jgi:hypothetical protein
MGCIVGLAAASVAVRAVERQIAFASGGMDGAVPRKKDPAVIKEARGGGGSRASICLHLPQVGQRTQSLSGERPPLSQGYRWLGQE